MKVPFSPPHISEEAIREVEDTLRSGWITTGPKTKKFEKELTQFCGNKATLCVNSATFGLEHILRWFGVGEGDEVILPAYTYCATANVVIHVGANPVLVDVNSDDFNISLEAIAKHITPRTKVIIPVDIGGLPADYDGIMEIVLAKKKMFDPQNDVQRQLNRILILSDAAHSLGAWYKGKRTGSLADVTVFSFHAVKNLTTAEGGAIALNLPDVFDNNHVYKELNILSLHGQSKDALQKTQAGQWRYDVIEAGFKGNMTDIQASLGLVALRHYENETLKHRKEICDFYNNAFAEDERFELPVLKDEYRESSYHLYPLRIKNITEKTRDKIMKYIFEQDVSVNVHFQPLPLLSAYKKLGFKIEDFPTSYNNYAREISLPVFLDITEEQLAYVVDVVKNAVNKAL